VEAKDLSSEHSDIASNQTAVFKSGIKAKKLAAIACAEN
jgi:hypothetical protein